MERSFSTQTMRPDPAQEGHNAEEAGRYPRPHDVATPPRHAADAAPDAMTRSRRPTSSEVARRAGVSRSTVSFVLNDVSDIAISDATRERVIAAAQELGYVPSAAARTLASGVSRTIGLVICHAEHIKVDAFIPRALYSLNNVCHREGYRVLVETVEDVRQPDAYQQLVLAKQIDGLVVLNPRHDDRQLPRFIENGFPIVVLGNPDIDDAIWIDIDNEGAARRATLHLLGQGRKRVAHIPYGSCEHDSVRARLRGYRAALAERGLDFDPDLVAAGDFSAESGYEAMRAILRAARPDAIFCGNDMVAFGAMRAALDAGITIPGDLAVIGFDDIPLAAYGNPTLSTVSFPAEEIGRRAARIVLDLVRGRRPRHPHTVLDTELVLRGSS